MIARLSGPRLSAGTARQTGISLYHNLSGTPRRVSRFSLVYSPQAVRHLTRQADTSSDRLTNPMRIPTRIALTTLVAVIPTANSRAARKAVPSKPTSSAFHEPQQHLTRSHLHCSNVVRVNAPKYTAATASTATNAVGVKVNTPVICRKAAITPTIKLTTTDTNVQLHLHGQQRLFIIFTSAASYAPLLPWVHLLSKIPVVIKTCCFFADLCYNALNKQIFL